MRGISLLSEEVVASQEALFSVELVELFLRINSAREFGGIA
jgi:hypothetical protein